MTGCFSLLALALACIGIYGIMAYTVTARTAEIGLRIALGATATQVIGRILREALWLAGFGILIGLAAALWLARFIGSMLYGLGIADPLTMGATALLLILRVVDGGVCSSSPSSAHRSHSCAEA